ncbi:MAG: hypothetical protein Q8R39_02350 [bacterium]|nr:hypothetical protein [bacterium]
MMSTLIINGFEFPVTNYTVTSPSEVLVKRLGLERVDLHRAEMPFETMFGKSRPALRMFIFYTRCVVRAGERVWAPFAAWCWGLPGFGLKIGVVYHGGNDIVPYQTFYLCGTLG